MSSAFSQANGGLHILSRPRIRRKSLRFRFFRGKHTQASTCPQPLDRPPSQAHASTSRKQRRLIYAARPIPTSLPLCPRTAKTTHTCPAPSLRVIDNDRHGISSEKNQETLPDANDETRGERQGQGSSFKTRGDPHIFSICPRSWEPCSLFLSFFFTGQGGKFFLSFGLPSKYAKTVPAD